MLWKRSEGSTGSLRTRDTPVSDFTGRRQEETGALEIPNTHYSHPDLLRRPLQELFFLVLLLKR